MPSANGELSQEERDKVVNWLTEHRAATTSCPMCEFEHWGVAPNLVLLPLFYPGGFVVGAGFPVVLIVCDRCGFVRMHNAIAMGIIEPPKDEKQGQPQSEEAKHGA